MDGFDPSVGDGAVEQLRHQMGAGDEVVGVFGPPGGLVNGIDPDQALANFHRGTLLHMLVGIIVSHPFSKRKSVYKKF